MRRIILITCSLLIFCSLAFAQDETNSEIEKKRKAAAAVRKGLELEDSLKVDLAIAEFSKAIVFRADYSEAYYHRARLYSDKGKLEKAFEDFEKAILFNPADANAYLGRGNLFMKKKEFESAFEDFEIAVTFDPENIVSRNNLVLAGFIIRKLSTLAEHIDYVLENDEEEEYFAMYKYKGRIHYSFNEVEESLENLDKYLEKYPDDIQGLEFRSETYQLKGDYSKAFEDSEKAQKLKK